MPPPNLNICRLPFHFVILVFIYALEDVAIQSAYLLQRRALYSNSHFVNLKAVRHVVPAKGALLSSDIERRYNDNGKNVHCLPMQSFRIFGCLETKETRYSSRASSLKNNLNARLVLSMNIRVKCTPNVTLQIV
ncbi:hypothetical protein EDD22DRAFT_846465 [Suillus occidentalis]|nr:hypothetical protein EDD22DRAFT_846465 [Suillus occidentalis]